MIYQGQGEKQGMSQNKVIEKLNINTLVHQQINKIQWI